MSSSGFNPCSLGSALPAPYLGVDVVQVLLVSILVLLDRPSRQGDGLSGQRSGLGVSILVLLDRPSRQVGRTFFAPCVPGFQSLFSWIGPPGKTVAATGGARNELVSILVLLDRPSRHIA